MEDTSNQVGRFTWTFLDIWLKLVLAARVARVACTHTSAVVPCSCACAPRRTPHFTGLKCTCCCAYASDRPPSYTSHPQFRLSSQVLEIWIGDSPMTGRTEVGRATFPLSQLAADGTADVWLPVESSMPGVLRLFGLLL